MTRPVPNMLAPIVDKMGKLLPPWNSFFQQFVQNAPAIQTIKQNPFTANQNGTVIINSAATATSLTRGSIVINLGAGQKIIPVSIGDTITTDGTSQFLGS
jgi:hypothetical protein